MAFPWTRRSRDRDPFALLQDLGTAQATAFLGLGSELLIVGSNPAELHLLSEAQATEGTLESRILKGAPLADWGRAYVEADLPPGTNVDLQYRVGSTETPDGTWSPWTPPLKSGERPNLQPTRFAQFKLKLTSSRGGTTPVVEGVQDPLGQPQPGTAVGEDRRHASRVWCSPATHRRTTSASSGCPWRSRS